MKKYFFGLTAIGLAIGFSAFTIKKHFYSGNDLIFKATASTQVNVENETQYNASATSNFVCPSTTKVVACKLLAVADKYTHTNGQSQVILNTAADNPQDEPLLFVWAVATTGSNYKIDYLTASDVGSGLTHFGVEGTDFTNGDLPE